jgi:hypothetical protein
MEEGTNKEANHHFAFHYTRCVTLNLPNAVCVTACAATPRSASTNLSLMVLDLRQTSSRVGEAEVRGMR